MKGNQVFISPRWNDDRLTDEERRNENMLVGFIAEEHKNGKDRITMVKRLVNGPAYAAKDWADAVAREANKLKPSSANWCQMKIAEYSYKLLSNYLANREKYLHKLR